MYASIRRSFQLAALPEGSACFSPIPIERRKAPRSPDPEPEHAHRDRRRRRERQADGSPRRGTTHECDRDDRADCEVQAEQPGDGGAEDDADRAGDPGDERQPAEASAAA